jgi:hypothetical protein
MLCKSLFSAASAYPLALRAILKDAGQNFLRHPQNILDRVQSRILASIFGLTTSSQTSLLTCAGLNRGSVLPHRGAFFFEIVRRNASPRGLRFRRW